MNNNSGKLDNLVITKITDLKSVSGASTSFINDDGSEDPQEGYYFGVVAMGTGGGTNRPPPTT